jgi:putative transposase
MKGKRFKEEQIIRILQEVDGGKSVAEICREHGVSEQSVYRWRSLYGGMDIAELHRLKQVEEENRRLRSVVAEQAVDIQILKEVNSKKW